MVWGGVHGLWSTSRRHGSSRTRGGVRRVVNPEWLNGQEVTAGCLTSQRMRLGFLGKILAYQMRTLSDRGRDVTKGGTLTRKKIKIWEMEAGTDGCSRPS